MTLRLSLRLQGGSCAKPKETKLGAGSRPVDKIQKLWIASLISSQWRRERKKQRKNVLNEVRQILNV